MGIGDVNYTLLQTVNEVQRKLGLNQTSLTNNKLSVQLVDHVNDVVNDLSDYGNWQELLASANVTVQSSVNNYSIQTSAVIKNIGDVFISNRAGPLRNVDIDDMRIMTRVTAYGLPSQYSIFGTDANANPNLRFRPIPTSANLPAVFSIVYYVKPPVYTTSDSSVIIPFPSRVVVVGTMARFLLNESEGAPTPMYQQYQNEYLEARREALNRYNFDTGFNISFTPGRRGRGRR